MTATSTEYPCATFRYLSRADVVKAIESVDVLAVVAEGLRAHATGRTELPAEAYLGWHTREGFAARCLAMPGALSAVDGPWYGLKVINGSLGNPARGIAGSQGFTMLFHPETARPVVVMEAAYISALRTAAVIALAARRLGVATQRALAVISCGTLARVHANLLLDTVPTLREVALFDTEPARAKRLAAALARAAGPDCADLVVVDDWDLMRADEHRVLGRMYRAGKLLGPDSSEDATRSCPVSHRSQRMMAAMMSSAW